MENKLDFCRKWTKEVTV